MRILLILLLLLSPAFAQGPALRLAAWNLHNLFDEVDDDYADQVPKPRVVDRKLDQLAAILNSIDADVLGVEEVENLPLLQRLARKLRGMRWVVLCEGNDRVRGIDVGLLSRVPLKGYRSHRGMSVFSRDCLEVHVAGPLPMVVLVNHFKSKLGGDSSDRRRREQALAVAAILRGLPQTEVAVLGDLNDSPHSWALEPLLQMLYDPFGPLELERRYTHVHRKQLAVLDHILLSKGLKERAGNPKVWRLNGTERASDHYPLSVDLAVR